MAPFACSRPAHAWPSLLLRLFCFCSCLSQVSELTQRLMVVAGEDGLSREAQRNATTMFMALMRANLASKRILKVRRQCTAPCVHPVLQP